MNVLAAFLLVIGTELLIAALILHNGALTAAGAITCGLGLIGAHTAPRPRP